MNGSRVNLRVGCSRASMWSLLCDENVKSPPGTSTRRISASARSLSSWQRLSKPLLANDTTSNSPSPNSFISRASHCMNRTPGSHLRARVSMPEE